MDRTNDNQAAPSRRNRKGAMVLWGVLVAAGSCAPAISTAGAETRADARNLTQGQIAVYSTQVPMAVAPAAGAERLSVVAWVDQADRTYAVGEHVRLFVRANKEAYLAVLNVGGDGSDHGVVSERVSATDTSGCARGGGNTAAGVRGEHSRERSDGARAHPGDRVDAADSGERGRSRGGAVRFCGDEPARAGA